MHEEIFYNIPNLDLTPISERPDDKPWTVSYGKLIVVNAPPYRKVYINFNLISEYKIGDEENERIAIVYAHINGAGKQKELANIWGLHYNTVNNYIAAYIREGLKGLSDQHYQPTTVRTSNKKKPAVVHETIERFSLFSEKETINETEETKETPVKSHETADHNSYFTVEDNINKTEKIQKTEESFDKTNVKECSQSNMETQRVPLETMYGGKMLYYPLVNEMYEGILKKAESVEDKESKKTFGLKQIIITLLFFVLCGITNLEKSKSLRRKEFGVLIGENTAPCCKTLRTGLNMLTVEGFPEYIMGELPRQYVKQGYVKLGIFYVDGHFIPYYGKKELHKGYCTQRRIAMTGHYQNWVNDVKGRPVFFYVNNSFVKFTDAIRNSIADAKKLMAEAGISERLIVVFDRGAFDGKFFTELDSMKIGFITWLKGKHPVMNETDLNIKLSYKNRKGEDVEYMACKDKISIKNYRNSVEAITVYDRKTKKQSTFINNLEYVGITDKSDSYKIELLDGRWAQENFFKEAKVKADIDHQTGYQFEEGDDGEDMEYEVANPEYVTLHEELQSLGRKLEISEKAMTGMMAQYQKQKHKKALEDYLSQKGNSRIIDNNREIKKNIEAKQPIISTIPARVPYNTIQENRKDILKTVRSAILLSIRASGYNIMKRFEDLAAECFKDHRELGKFVLSLLDTSAEIKTAGNSVFVKLRPLETPVYQRAAEKLIEKINEKHPVTMDGTNRRIEFGF